MSLGCALLRVDLLQGGLAEGNRILEYFQSQKKLSFRSCTSTLSRGPPLGLLSQVVAFYPKGGVFRITTHNLNPIAGHHTQSRMYPTQPVYQSAYIDPKYNGVPPNTPLPMTQPATVTYPPTGVAYTPYTPYPGQPTVAYGMADPFDDSLAREKKMRKNIKLIKLFALIGIIGGILFVAANLTYAGPWVWGRAIQRTGEMMSV